MSYCPNCGVELSRETENCPLCAFDMKRISGTCSEESPRPAAGGMQEVLGSHGMPTPVWEVISVAALITASVIAGVNLLDSGSLTWSMYPVFSLGLVWTLVTASFVGKKNLPAAVALAALSLPIYLVCIDAIDGTLVWAFPVAIPIALICELAATGAIVASLHARRKGMNVIGFILIAVSAICLGVESTVDIFGHGQISLHWSAITSLTLVPISAFLLYLHHRVVKKANLHKLLRF